MVSKLDGVETTVFQNEIEILDDFMIATESKGFLNKIRSWSQANSLWVLPFMTGCCSLEYISAMRPKNNMNKLGVEDIGVSPRHSDLLIVSGTITEKQVPVLRKVYDQMAFPKWVMAIGSCASSGGMYRSYHVVQGISRVIPVDIYVPGCPPTPEAIIEGVLKLKDRIKNGITSVWEENNG